MIADKLILDIKGLVIQSMKAGTDSEAPKDMGENGDGKPINSPGYTLKNFIDMHLKSAFERYSPLNIIAVWDPKGKTYRHSLYPEYKAHKLTADPKSAERLAVEEDTYGMIKGMLASLGITQCQSTGIEADDVIAWLCKLRSAKEIWTRDADLLQLCNMPNVKVVVRGQTYEADEMFTDSSGSWPVKHTVMYKALCGDGSDGYKGVPGFGPAAFVKVVTEFGEDTLDELANCCETGDFTLLRDAVEGTGNTHLKKILDHRAELGLCYRLAKLHPEMVDSVFENKLTRPEWYRRLPNRDRLMQVLNRAGLAHRADMFDAYMPTNTLVTADNLGAVVERILALKAISPFPTMDIESYDTLKNENFKVAANGRDYVDPLSQKVTGMSVCLGSNQQHTFYFSCFHKDTANLDWETMTDVVKEFADKPIAHNADFEMLVLRRNFGVQIESPLDTRIMSSYVDENTPNGLKDIALRLLNHKMDTYKETLERAGAADMSEISGKDVMHYGCDDSFVTAHLAAHYAMILDLEGQLDFVLQHETQVTEVLSYARETGDLIDLDRLKQLEQDDEKAHASAWVRLKDVLLANCREENPDAALNFFESDKDYWVAKFKEDWAKKRQKALDKGEADEFISEQAYVQQAVEDKRNELIRSSKYIPLQTVQKEVNFLPTSKQIGEVMALLGLPEEFALPSVTPSGITKLITAIQSRREEFGEKVDEFLRLIAAASDEIKARAGEDYERFAEFCSTVLAANAKTESVGDELNLGSPPQMGSLLYCKLGLPVRVRTKIQAKGFRHANKLKGSPATDKKAMEMALAEDANDESDFRRIALKAARIIKDAETRSKLYYKPYPLWLHPLDGKLHPGILNCGTVTRRPTGSSPNFLQIAKGKMRSIIIPHHKDARIVAKDFSGQELRIMTSESKDEVLLDAYLGEVEKDIHSVTATGVAMIFLSREMPELWKKLNIAGLLNHGRVDYNWFVANRKLEKDATPEQVAIYDFLDKCRQIAKVVNFLIIYGGGPTTLARNLGIPVDIAKTIMQSVFTAYQGIKPWQNSVIEFARRHGYVETAFGTRKHMTSHILSSVDELRMRAERQAVNQTIQGCAADILKIVLGEMKRKRVLERHHAKLIAPVYDEVAASVMAAAIYDYNCEMDEIMSILPPGHAVRMKPETDVGPNWGEMLELKAFPSREKVESAILWVPDRLQPREDADVEDIREALEAELYGEDFDEVAA